MPRIAPPTPLSMIRLRAGMKQEYVADSLGISRSMVGMIEGGHTPAEKYLPRLAELYGVPRSELETAAAETVNGRAGR